MRYRHGTEHRCRMDIVCGRSPVQISARHPINMMVFLLFPSLKANVRTVPHSRQQEIPSTFLIHCSLQPITLLTGVSLYYKWLPTASLTHKIKASFVGRSCLSNQHIHSYKPNVENGSCIRGTKIRHAVVPSDSLNMINTS